MATLDTNIALGVRPIQLENPVEQYSRMAQLQNAQNQNALAQYQIHKAKREDEATDAMNALYSKHYNPETGAVNQNALLADLASSNLGSKIPDIQSKLLEAQSKAATLAETKQRADTGNFKLKIDKANKAISDIAALNSPQEAVASIDQHVKNGDIDQSKADMLKGQLAQAPSFGAWQKSMLTNILDAKEKLTLTAPKPTEVNLNNKKIFIDLNPNSPTFQKEVVPQQTVGMTPNEAAMLPIHKAQLKVAQDRLQAEMATGNISPNTVDFIAETYRQTGTLPPLGMGPMAASLRSKILERAGQLSMGGDKTAAEAAADVKSNKAETAGMTSGQRAVGTQIANIQVASNEASKMIEVAKPYVNKVDPTDYPTLNAVGNFVARKSGDPNITGLATSLNSLVNTYARAINPKGVATVSDKNHAREILNEAMSKGQLNEAFAVMQQEMAAAKASGPETRAAMRGGAAPAAKGVVTHPNFPGFSVGTP
ncbi:hypothetical protein UFOVP160_17 [uncultured Caudovirales phage]|uniref:Uncharacterized protein n=1 Tax=uncultured Caudovirales phage TaxID=2100421 RepID=A0A6J7WGW6_9CAUD|nr:hypothetical protein UFOVP160_17 [uncultured Caudovirales phage]